MKLLLFAGAGTSVELGVPAMLGLGEEFLAHADQWQVEPELTHKLMGRSLDIEHLLAALDKICSARDSLEVIGEAGTQLDRIDKIRAEVEWFVQHAAERVVAADARLMWGPLLRASAAIELTLVTTNYDRSIELAANAEQIAIADGFSKFGNGETASWEGFPAESKDPILVKLHGSTDWYSAGHAGVATKLRHPMPLFGRATLRLAGGVELCSALVLPSREKLLTHAPYPRLSQNFLNSSDSCDVAVFVGTSLRDPDIRDAAEAIAKRVPAFLVSPSGDSYDIPEIRPIGQYASSFLISILPAALQSSDPVAALDAAAATHERTAGILDAVRTTLDAGARIDNRCGAIDLLSELGYGLDQKSIEQLLEDPDPTIARYSLGLVTSSPSALSLIETAKTSMHSAEPTFAEDLQLLGDLIE